MEGLAATGPVCHRRYPVRRAAGTSAPLVKSTVWNPGTPIGANSNHTLSPALIVSSPGKNACTSIPLAISIVPTVTFHRLVPSGCGPATGEPIGMVIGVAASCAAARDALITAPAMPASPSAPASCMASRRLISLRWSRSNDLGQRPSL